jgi:hypothetical protein
MPDPGAVAAIMIWAEAFGMAIDRSTAHRGRIVTA